MKLHIECLQEKVEAVTKEKESNKKEAEEQKFTCEGELDRIKKMMKELQEDFDKKIKKLSEREEENR